MAFFLSESDFLIL